MSRRLCRVLFVAIVICPAIVTADDLGNRAKQITNPPPPTMNTDADSTARFPVPFADKAHADAGVGDVDVSGGGTRVDRVSPAANRSSDEAIPFPARSKAEPSPPRDDEQPTAGRAMTTVLGSLGIVLAAFFVFVWVTRRAAPKGLAMLPSDVLESLGRAPLAGRQQMQLIRLGSKLILLSVTNGEARTLTEVTDPDEAVRLAGLCKQNQPGSITATFRQVLSQATTEPESRPARAHGDASLASHAALPGYRSGARGADHA
jgi:flagellar biogenesis protein FliO